MIDSEYDFSQGKRGAVESVPPGKTCKKSTLVRLCPPSSELYHQRRSR